MTDYTSQEIKKLSNETGAGFLDCKNALDEAEGNYEKARQLIKGNKELHIEPQKSSKITSVESEIEKLKLEILEIKKAHNALIVALERAAANEKSSSKNSRVQPVMYGTYFLGDFSG
jgi:uncharacterized coiled-coil DUF342 family protein